MLHYFIRFAVLLCFPTLCLATDYYLDATNGQDANLGTSSDQAWQTLSKANSLPLAAGDRILLKSGQRFTGKILLHNQSGSLEAPIHISSYGEGAKPIIDAAGYLAGIHLRNSQHIDISNLEITADGGATIDSSDSKRRYGVYVNAEASQSFSHISLRDLYIHTIYPENDTEHEGKNPTTYVGTAIAMRGDTGAISSNILVQNCHIEDVGFKAIELFRLSHAEVLENEMKDIGGPAIQPGRVDDLLVKGNTVDGSGAYTDTRMHGRGSGIWPWTSNRVLIERNKFMHARGRGDTCGIHIDFNCADVVVQYNLSLDNEGGFVEILGNNYNCAYRYNISINDGARVNGENGATQWGHTLWLSSYTGNNNPRNGPFNTYIYNNTIYTKADIVSKYSFARTTDGAFIANNIFYVEGDSQDVYTTWENSQEPGNATHQNIIWKNNLYLKVGTLPNTLAITDTEPITGNPLFLNTGGLAPEDYIPTDLDLIEDQGIPITKLPGDTIGLRIGLEVDQDYFGNPIIGLPEMGAIELSGSIDTDGDRIPNQIEKNYLLNPADPSDGDTDLDEDGTSNHDEYLKGTRLDKAHDQLPILVSDSSSKTTLTLPSSHLHSDRIYTLETTSDLGKSDPWKETNPPASNENGLTFELPPNTAYYRLKIAWP